MGARVEAAGKLAGRPHLGLAYLRQHHFQLAGRHRNLQRVAVDLTDLPGGRHLVGQLAAANVKHQAVGQVELGAAVGRQAGIVEAGVFDAADQGVVENSPATLGNELLGGNRLLSGVVPASVPVVAKAHQRGQAEQQGLLFRLGQGVDHGASKRLMA